MAKNLDRQFFCLVMVCFPVFSQMSFYHKTNEFAFLDKKIDHCQSRHSSDGKDHYCGKRGKCVSAEHGPVCQCYRSFMGPRCEYLKKSRRVCKPNPCMHRGRCYAIAGVPETLAHPEVGSGKITRRYQCICLPGLHGDNCQYTPARIKCETEFCGSFGRGTFDEKKRSCTCLCELDHEGNRCQITLPCGREQNACGTGNCTNNIGQETFSCTCHPGFSKDSNGKCSIFDSTTTLGCDPCNNARINRPSRVEELPCHKYLSSMGYHLPNRPDLLDYDAIYQFWPLSNEAHMEDGLKKPCFQSEPLAQCKYATVRSDGGSEILVPSCSCSETRRGEWCEQLKESVEHPACALSKTEKIELGRVTRCMHTDECSTDPTNKKLFHCRCPDQWYGTICQYENPCWKSPCVERGVAKCTKMPEDLGTLMDLQYACVCKAGQYGPNCLSSETDKVCSPNPCRNNGTCVPCQKYPHLEFCLLPDGTAKSFVCLCALGWSGKKCEHKISNCDRILNPCKNGGICDKIADDPLGYRCDCRKAYGYGGKHCDVLTDICLTGHLGTYCENGHCKADANAYEGFQCKCNKGWTGHACQIKDKQRFLGLSEDGLYIFIVMTVSAFCCLLIVLAGVFNIYRVLILRKGYEAVPSEIEAIKTRDLSKITSESVEGLKTEDLDNLKTADLITEARSKPEDTGGLNTADLAALNSQDLRDVAKAFQT